MPDEHQLPDHTSGGYTVYGLTDPDSGEVRYVGSTWNAKRRYAQHCNWRGTRKGSRLREWLRELDANGKKPGFRILVRLTGPESQFVRYAAERRAIQRYSYLTPGRLLQTAHVASPSESGRLARMVTLNGRTQGITAWAKELGISRQRLHQRLAKYPPRVALTTPRGEVPNHS